MRLPLALTGTEQSEPPDAQTFSLRCGERGPKKEDGFIKIQNIILYVNKEKRETA